MAPFIAAMLAMVSIFFGDVKCSGMQLYLPEKFS